MDARLPMFKPPTVDGILAVGGRRLVGMTYTTLFGQLEENETLLGLFHTAWDETDRIAPVLFDEEQYNEWMQAVPQIRAWEGFYAIPRDKAPLT